MGWKWYSLIDSGGGDGVCEQNSKRSLQDEGVGGGGVARGKGEGVCMRKEENGGVGWRHRARKLHCVVVD